MAEELSTTSSGKEKQYKENDIRIVISCIYYSTIPSSSNLTSYAKQNVNLKTLRVTTDSLLTVKSTNNLLQFEENY